MNFWPLLICLGLSFPTKAQIFEKIPFQDSHSASHPLYQAMEISDTTALIVLLIERNHWYNGNRGLVFYQDGRVLRCKLVNPKDLLKEQNWILEDLSSREIDSAWLCLEDCIAKDLFDLGQRALDNHSKPIVGGKTSKLTVSDGNFYRLRLIWNRRELTFNALSPRTYIEASFPGKEDKIKFVELIESFQVLFLN